jgi:hypothetical protein
MSETNWFDKMMAEQAAEEELDRQVESGEITEGAALEILMKATITKFESLPDAFEADPEAGKKVSFFREFDESKLPELRKSLVNLRAKVEGLGARLLAKKGRNP